MEPSPANDFELRPRTIGALSKLLFRDNGGAGRMLCFADLEDRCIGEWGTFQPDCVILLHTNIC